VFDKLWEIGRSYCLWYTSSRVQELISCIPLVRHGSHLKRRLQHFFVAAGTSLPSCYLATKRGYAGRPTESLSERHGPHIKWRVQTFLCFCMYSMPRERLLSRCIAIKGGMHFTEPLPNNDRRDKHTLAQTDGKDLLNTPLRWAQVPYTIFLKICSSIRGWNLAAVKHTTVQVTRLPF
jgi:hypothetical protein